MTKMTKMTKIFHAQNNYTFFLTKMQVNMNNCPANKKHFFLPADML